MSFKPHVTELSGEVIYRVLFGSGNPEYRIRRWLVAEAIVAGGESNAKPAGAPDGLFQVRVQS